MQKIHFKADLLPKHKKFRVEVILPNSRYVELMTIARFLRFAKDTGPIKIGGLTVNFEDDKNKAQDAVRAYFKEIADAYIDTRYKNN